MRHSEHTLRLARTFARVVLCRHDVLVPDDLLGRVKRHQVELLNLGNSALVAGNLWESKDTEAEEPSQLGCFHISQGNSKTAAQSSVHLIHIFFNLHFCFLSWTDRNVTKLFISVVMQLNSIRNLLILFPA